MENQFQILDAEATGIEFDPKPHLADRSKRFINMLIDTAGYYLLVFVVSILIGISGAASYLEGEIFLGLLSLAILFAYYFVFEVTFGKTPGKIVTGTRVLTVQGLKPSAAQIAGRTLSRFVPFDAFSFLDNRPVGWHDKWSGTCVVKDKRPNN